MSIKTIAFDLDDTLIDTTGILIPEASLSVFNHMKMYGLSISYSDYEHLRLKKIKEISHKDYFHYLAKNFGTDQTLNCVDKAVQLFYHPTLPKNLILLPQAHEVLKYCSEKYSLYAVTAGFFEAQIAKIKHLNIESFFKKIYVVNSLNDEKKFHAFQKIIEFENIKSQELLCVGNSLSSEIQDGKLIQAKTCYFEFGEDRGKSMHDPAYKPDYHIKNLSEFIKTCQL